MPLTASLVIAIPRSDAIARVRQYFQERRCENRRTAGLPVRVFGLSTGVRLYRGACIDVDDLAVRTAFTPHAEHALAVRWQPTRGVMPALRGTLTARAHAVHATLHFEGTAVPQRGGPAFRSAFIGRCLARLAIDALLRDIRRDLARSVPVPTPLPAGAPSGGHDGGLRGRAFVRRDGSYVACTIVLDGNVDSRIVAGDRTLSVARVEALLRVLETSHLRTLPERRAH